MSLGKPPRLEQVFQKYDPPVYFVTLCTNSRRQLLANDAVHSAVVESGCEAVRRGIALGRYVILPDHIHLFVAGDDDFDLGIWVRGLKRVVAAAVSGGRGGLWQRGFLIISSEAARVIRRNGITFSKTQFEPGWSRPLISGRSKERLYPSTTDERFA